MQCMDSGRFMGFGKHVSPFVCVKAGFCQICPLNNNTADAVLCR